MANKKYTNRELMQMTIDEMNKSINEPRPDGKVPPKVGALLLFPNGRIEKAYRGQLREGDHAEFTLLERKLGNEDLEGCILFTTLEPCVKRNPQYLVAGGQLMHVFEKYLLVLKTKTQLLTEKELNTWKIMTLR